MQFALHEVVEVAHHLGDLGEVGLRQILQALLHPLKVLLQELALQFLHQRVEILAGAGVHKVVVAQLLDAAARARGERVELLEAAVRHAAQHIGEVVRGRLAAGRLPARRPRLAAVRRVRVARGRIDLAEALGDALALLADDLLEPLLYAVEH